MPEAIFGAAPPAIPEPAPEPAPALEFELEPSPLSQSPPARRFADVLGELARDVERGQHLIDRVLHGAATPSALELIALQAGIYRYAEAIDLAAKIVDRAGQAVRTTLGGSGG